MSQHDLDISRVLTLIIVFCAFPLHQVINYEA